MPNPPKARRFPALLLAATATCVVALVATTLSTPAVASTQTSRVGVKHASIQDKTHAKHEANFSRAVRAKHALARAKKAFAPETAPDERPDATLALRNLWLLKDSLSAADRAVADTLGARPTYGIDKASGGCPPQRCEGVPATLGDANILMHYEPTELAYDPAVAFQQIQYVADTYANSGYRRPKSDGTKGGDGRVDIYIAQLDPGLYGYCTTDQKKLSKPGHFDVWAYCVLDADYLGFPRTPIENFEVTIAHEYYHATQFAYDIADDGWLLESTAATMEDELYPAINDNFQYLADSPITHPGRSMDKFANGGVFHYGVWNFFRYLIERNPAKVGALPKIMLDIWKYADSSKGPRKDLYSTQAVDKMLKKDARSSLAEQFANYSAATPATHLTFAEGAALNYPSKPIAGQATLSGKKKKSFRTKLDQSTSATYQFNPGGGTTKLKLTVRMAPKSHGSRAVVVVYGPSGIVQTKAIKVNARGIGHRKVTFDASVSAVQVTLVNASYRFTECYRHQNGGYPCSGLPVDQNQRAMVMAKVA